MKYPWFIAGFCITVAAFIGVNAFDRHRQEAAYYALLEERRMVWAGSWTWGLPFPMMLEGLGTESEKYSMVMPSAALNLVICLVVAGLVGIAFEHARENFRPKDQ